MPSAPRGDDEAARLDALRRYDILGTPPEQALDDLTRLAAYVCATPMAAVVLVDEHRQWFKSRVGVTIDEVPRALSFSAYAILEADVVVVPDTRADPRFADHPQVLAEPGIHFYAGAPLRTPDGYALGTLAVFDHAPRGLTPEQRQGLRVLGRQVMAQIELRRQALALVRGEVGTLGTMADRRRVAEALRDKTVHLEAALGITRMGVWFGDLQTDEVFMVHAGGPVSGLPPAILPTTGTAFMALVHPDDRAAVGARMAQATRDGQYETEFRIVLPDGETRWVSARGQCLKGAGDVPMFLTGVDLDITERKRAEARVEHLNRVYGVLSDINQTIVREPDLATILSSACRTAVEKAGYRMAWIGLVDQATGALVRRADAGADDATAAIIDWLIRVDPPGGCAFTRRALETGQPGVCDDIAGDPAAEGWREAALARGYRTMMSLALTLGTRVVGTFNIYAGEPGFFDAEERRLLAELATDISFAVGIHEREAERLRAEEQRQVAEDRFRQLAETIQQVFWMCDVTLTEIYYVSPAYETIWGRSCASLYASPRTWMDAIHPDDQERVEQAWFLRARRGDYDEVYRIVRPDGTVRWIRDRGFPIRDERGEVRRMLGTAADITDQRQLEEQLRQAQKMESVGRLAGGVAHDFNNLLTVINGMADLAIAGLDEDSAIRRDLQQIRLAGDRAAALTGRLLAISRRQILKPEVLNLTTVVEDLETMIHRVAGEDVSVVLALSRDLASVKADPGQIEQVLLNLVVNARDAMPDGGTLTIETRGVSLDADDAAERPGMRPGPHAMVAVSDTGVGMDEVTRQRIFEPFFTTKALGKGTGLGLSMVYGIVKQSGGVIEVASEPGHGATFRIYLPAVAERPAPRASTAAPAVARGHETVLVVEDEPALRELTTRVLTGAGYKVLEAGTGAEALALLERHPEDVDLLFTDVVMPGMTGRELAVRLASLRPAMRVLYTSGYTEDAILRYGVLDDASRFLTKPYTPAELRRRIREALDS
jgi:two-component system cell cycle sensor histidine kinase/response regulator CckA